jgi:CheY-like chemotaxis protein
MAFTIRNIILADDDSDDRTVFEEALQELDPKLKLDYVRDGNELLSMLQHYCPDILFLDLEMPYKNGLQCLLEIRSNGALQNLPVVVFSATNRPANIQTAYEVGAHLFFIKPNVYQEYLSSIKSILSLDWSHPDAVKEQYCVNGRYTAFV